MDGQVPGECELKELIVFRSNTSITVAIEQVSVVVASWSIGNSESLDEGDVCGEVDDRTTSVDDFDMALARGDGQGFGSLMYTRVSYQGAGGVVDTMISSSMVTGARVSSFSGAPSDVPPATMGYGRTFFTSHVNLGDVESGLRFSFPLLFHDPSGCLDEETDLDY